MTRHDPLILVIDDDPQLVRAIRTILAPKEFEVASASSGAEAMDRLLDGSPQLIVMELTLPDIDGLALLERLRAFTQLPIMVLSVRASDADKVAALTGGADDYLVKPFSPGEFVARIGVLLRRSSGVMMVPTLRVGDVHIDFAHRRVMRACRPIHLTPTEYAILETLASNPDRVMTRRQIVDAVWGSELEADAATLRVHVSNIRRKLEPDPRAPRYLLTEPHVGFRLSTGG